MSLDHYGLPPKFFNNESMTIQEQLEWLHERERRDFRWADTEVTVRRLAVEVQNRLSKSSTNEIVSVSVARPSEHGYLGMEYQPVRFIQTRIGGTEELLLIEEQIRRAMRSE